MSRLTLGTAFRQGVPENVALATIDAALDAGCNSVDTSNVYHTGTGVLDGDRHDGLHSERILSKALRGRRDRFVVTTKVGAPELGDPSTGGLGRVNVIEGCERSLRRLGTEYLDFYICHFPDPHIRIDETLEAMTTLVDQGKVREIGCSSYESWRLYEALATSDRGSLPRFACNQVGYSLLDRRIEDELLPYCRQAGVAVTVFAPTAIGLLSGRYRYGRPPPSGTSWHRGPYNYRAAMTPWVGAVIDAVATIADQHGKTPTQVALAWCMSRDGISSTIVGCDTPERAVENLAAAEWAMPPEDAQRLDDVSAGLRLQIRKDAPDGYGSGSKVGGGRP